MDTGLSYGSHLWGSVKAVEEQSDESRAFLKRLAAFVKDKAELDHHYSKSLRKLVDRLHIDDLPADGKTEAVFLSAFRECMLAIAASFDSAGQRADDVVVKPLQAYSEQHKKQGRQLEEDISRTLKTHSQHAEQLQQAQQACRRACDELLRAKEMPHSLTSPTAAAAPAAPSSASSPVPASASASSAAGMLSPASASGEPDALDAMAGMESLPEKKKRFGGLFKRDAGSAILRSMQSQMQTVSHSIQSSATASIKPDIPTLTERVLAADSKYVAAVKAMRSYRPQHDQALAHLLDAYQTLEQERRHTTVDMMATLLSLQSQLFSSSQQQLKDVSAVLGKVSPPRDVALFIREHRTEGKTPPLPVYEMMKGHPQYIEAIDGVQAEGKEDDGLGQEDEHGVVRKRTSKDAEEERSYHRIMAEQVLTLFVDKITGRAEDMKDREKAKRAEAASTGAANDSSAAAGEEAEDVLPDDKSRPLDEEELKVARRLFQTADGRTAFATVINLQRNRGQLHLSATAFERLAKLVLLFLDMAREAMHVAPIQLVMILSQSLWRDADAPPPPAAASSTASSSASLSSNPLSPSKSNPSLSTSRSQSSLSSAVPPKKLFLSTLINGHPVWTDDRFWEESFFDAFRSKLTEDQVRVHRWHSDTEQQESLHARKQAAFATLSTFAMNMAEFGMDRQEIDRFVEKHAHLNDLEGEQVEMLRTMDRLGRGPVGEADGEQEDREREAGAGERGTDDGKEER